MDHQLSETKIYETKDYDRFRMINGNRALNLKKIDRIIKDINEGNNMLRYKPIEVRESGNHLDILDGQHRMFISKKIKSPVYYIVVDEDKSMIDIVSINSNVEKWKFNDIINCYINQGIQDYVRLNAFISQYKIAIGSAVKLLDSGTPTYCGKTDSELMKNFWKGKFKVNCWDESVRAVENAKQFTSYLKWNDRAFIVAIYRINNAGKVPLEDIVAAVNKNPEKLTQEGSPMKYILKLEEILNLGKQNRRIIL